MKRVLSIYNRADIVAVLWMLSIVNPVALMADTQEVSWIPWAGALILLIIGITISQFRLLRIKEGNWAKSDFVAYIAVPITLFSFVATMVVFNAE